MAPQQLPRLDMSAIDNNPSLRPPSSDSLSPPTPSPGTMQKYRSPTNLPSPDGTATHDGFTWDRYGRTEVPQNFSQDHQQVRQHMAGTPSGQKYLAHLEQGSGNPVSIVPYEASGNRPTGISQAPGTRPIPTKINGKDVNSENTIGTQTEFHRHPNTDVPGKLTFEPKTLVTYPVNQGFVTGRGGNISAATMAAHELRHASQGPGRDYPPLGNWTDKSEKATITKGDNPTALAHGEGLRDDHKSSALFETGGVTSAKPLNPRANAAIANYRPELEQLTDELDANTGKPDATQLSSNAYNARSNSMGQLRQELDKLGPTSGTAS